jgi:RNA polymerase sigma factor (sigma-70 family)
MAKPNFKIMTEDEAKNFIKDHVNKKFTKNGPMLGKLPREERDDAINEIYIDLWNNRFNYDPSRSDFTTYAFNRGRGVVKSLLQSFSKINKIRNRISKENREDFYLSSNSYEKIELLENISTLLNQDELKILKLKFIEGHSVTDIAKIFGMTEQKIYSTIRESKMKCIKSDEV